MPSSSRTAFTTRVGRRVVLLKEESPSCFLGAALGDSRPETVVMGDGVNGAGAYLQTF